MTNAPVVERRSDRLLPPTRLDRAIYFLLMTAIVLAPLPLGSNRPWSWSLLSLTIALLALCWSIGAFTATARTGQGLMRLRPAALLFAAVIIWAEIQAASWTPAFLHHPHWLAAAEAIKAPVAGAISLSPADTQTAVMRLLAYAGTFWLCLQYARSVRRARRMIGILFIAGLLYALYGLFDNLVKIPDLYWSQVGEDRLYAPFVNPNNFATYIGLGFLCGVALLVPRQDHLDGHDPAGMHARFWVEYLLSVRGLVLAGMLFIVSALWRTGSRGGMLAFLIGVAVLVVALWRARMVTRRAFIIFCGLMVLGFVALTGIAGDRFYARVAVVPERIAAYELALQAIAERPLLGTGYGTYQAVGNMYRDERLSVPRDKLENTYLELALELGVPAALVLVAAAAVPVLLCLSGLWRRRQDRHYAALGLAAACLVGTHALVDFGAQIPAVAVTFWAIMGIACAQAWSQRA